MVSREFNVSRNSRYKEYGEIYDDFQMLLYFCLSRIPIHHNTSHQIITFAFSFILEFVPLFCDDFLSCFSLLLCSVRFLLSFGSFVKLIVPYVGLNIFLKKFYICMFFLFCLWSIRTIELCDIPKHIFWDPFLKFLVCF